jgi:hypothetical protein
MVSGDHDVFVVEDERPEEIDIAAGVLGHALQVVDLLLDLVDPVGRAPAAPARPDAVESVRGPFGHAADQGQRGAVVFVVADRPEFHARGQFVQEFVAGFLALETLPLVQARQGGHTADA